MENTIAFVVPITWLIGVEHGWGNGYVAIPKGHPLYGKDYNNIDCEIHGGLTFSDEWFEKFPEETKGMWIIGFDCAHWGDSPITCPKEFVKAEVQRLKEFVDNYKE